MKNTVKLSIKFALGLILLTIVGFSSNVKAQGSMQPIADTGLVHLERDEVMIIAVTAKKGYDSYQANHVQFETTGFSAAAGPGGGPHVKIFERIATGDVNGDGAYSIEAPATQGGVFTPAVRVLVSCDRAPRCVVSATVHKIVLTGGERKKEYVGHVTLIK